MLQLKGLAVFYSVFETFGTAGADARLHEPELPGLLGGVQDLSDQLHLSV